MEPHSWAPAEPPSPMRGRLAAFGVRALMRYAHWRGRREAEAVRAEGPDQRFRGFVQINLIRPH